MAITLEELYQNYLFNLGLLEARISALEEAGKKKKRKELKEKLSLEDAKSLFIQDTPEKRTDTFTDQELALWGLYLLYKTPRKEVITTWAELSKRAKLARTIVDFFRERGNKESDARRLAKDYLEMVLTLYPTFKGKEGEQAMGYFTATSNFAIGFYSQKMTNWKQVKNLPDESLD